MAGAVHILYTRRVASQAFVEVFVSLLNVLRATAVVLVIPVVALILSLIVRAVECTDTGNMVSDLPCMAGNIGPSIMPFAATAIGLGLGLIAIVLAAGMVARTHRALIVVIFAPGLYLVCAALALLSLMHGLLAIISIGFVVMAFPYGIFLFAFLGVAGAMLFGTLALLQAPFQLVHRVEHEEEAVTLAEVDQPELWRMVRELAARMNTKTPTHIIAGLNPTCYVTEATVTCLNGRIKGRTM